MSNVNGPYINVTPLIDILLVLIIIFMVISPLRPAKFETRVPDKLPADDRDYIMTDSLIVSIESDGSYQLNRDRAKTIDELERILRIALDRRPPERRAVFVKAPRVLRYGEVVRVIDVIKAAGSDPIGLQIDRLDR
jgi:biopolymer transport protein TolR